MANDIARLRELGRRVQEIAALPIQAENQKLWRAVNDRKMIRPAVFVRDYPIYLIEQGGELATAIEDEFLKPIEADLLLRLYEWKHLRCDRVVEPVVMCPLSLMDSGFGLDTSTDMVKFLSGSVYDTARSYDRQISTEEDLQKIREPVVSYDRETTLGNFARMQEVFDGILEVRLAGVHHFHCEPWDDLLSWMGIEEGMADFALRPEFMRKAVDRYVACSLSGARQYERLGLVASNNCSVKVGQGGPGYTSELPEPRPGNIGGELADNWGGAMDQILTSVSPEMTAEFAVEPERAWSEAFGLFYYGCCERLDHKVGEVRRFPKLRKVSMSPFAEIENGMAQLGSDVVVSFKPNSTYLAESNWDRERSRRELVRVCELARKYGCNVEIVMKTLLSLNGEPQRLWEWCDIAMEVVSAY